MYTFCGNNGIRAIDYLGLQCTISESISPIYKDSFTSDIASRRAYCNIKDSVRTKCSWGRLIVEGSFSRHIYMLRANNGQWNRRNLNYNAKWGALRDNNAEMRAAYAHEQDHYRSYDVYSNYVKELNAIDGALLRGCCKKESAKINAFLKRILKALAAFSSGFDKDPYNQGGMYDKRHDDLQVGNGN